jgi:lipopolysaccharide transport system ATP-binding protein
MSQAAIQLQQVGKMYKLYRRPADKVLDALGFSRFIPKFDLRYREFWALRELSLEIPRGQRLGLIGRNGSGKSTTLKIISGNIPATEGTVHVHGNVQALMELGTGFHPEFTGRQNIRASLAYHGLSRRKIQSLEDEIIDFTELEEFIDQPVKTYSAGMYARLAFSTATSIEPEILIIDEVLGAGDAYFSGKCVERMRRLTEESGATVLFVSHDLGSVQQLCERVIWIDRGRIVRDGPPMEVTKAYYASILQQEEVRLKARNARLSRRQAGEIAREEREGMRELLMRFIPKPEGPPRESHPIRRLQLHGASGFSAELEPGAPMDNDGDQAAHLLADRQYMNWSDPKVVESARVRCVENVGGKYLHAPFVFAVPQDAWLDGRFRLGVEHAAKTGEEIAVEYFHADAYHSIGRLEAGNGRWRTQEFEFTMGSPDDIVTPMETRVESGSGGVQDKWATNHAAFEEVLAIDGAGVPKQVFHRGEALGFQISVKVQRPLSPCWLALILYHQNGQQIASWIHRFEREIEPDRARWQVIVDRPQLRQGDYVASVELLSHYDPMATEKLPYYCHWNRCVVFRIDESYLGHIPLGLVELPFELKEIRA